MKFLMIFTNEFTYKTTTKTLNEFPDLDEQDTFNECLTVFIQVEKKDEEQISKSVTKLIKNIKWAAKKNETKKIVLHSFAHLSSSKATPEITKEIFDKAQQRLINANYETSQTPFGYFLDLNINAPGHSQARIFKDF